MDTGDDVLDQLLGDAHVRVRVAQADRADLARVATDRAGEIRWSMMAKATAGKVPSAIQFAAEDMARKFPPKAGAARLAKPAAGR